MSDEERDQQHDMEDQQEERSFDELEADAASQEERVDWKSRAIEASTRLEMLERMREEQTQPEQQVDEVTKLRQAIQEKRAGMPALDDKNPQTFWEREKIKEDIDRLNDELTEARLRKQEERLAEQQTTGAVGQYKQRHAGSAAFKAVEKQFDQMVGQLQPHLRGNQTMLEMIRKNLEYDHLQNQGNQRKPPPRAPDGAHNTPSPKPRSGSPTWRNEDDRKVGEYYMERGIISGPEEYYDPRFNELSASANNNGVAIYDVPTSRRGWRRS